LFGAAFFTISGIVPVQRFDVVSSVRIPAHKRSRGERCDVNTGRVLLVCDGIQEFLFYRGILSDLGYVFVICGCYEEGARRVATEDFDFAIVSQGSASFEGRCVLE
jgi:hypothetical protein